MKLRLIVVLAIFCLNLTNVNAQHKGVSWENYSSWKSVLEHAKKVDRPIFLDLYTTWCGPCKWMEKEVYVNDSVGEFLNREFIRVKVQMDSLKWDDENIRLWYSSAQELKNTYCIKAFPTIMFLSPNGEIYKKIEGATSVPTLLREAREALNPEKQFTTMLKVYESGNRNPQFVRQLVKLMKGLGDKSLARKIAKEYINSLTERDMLSKENIWFIYENTKTVSDRGFGFIRDFADTIENIEPKLADKYLISKLVMILEPEAIRPYRKSRNGRTDWKAIQAKISQHGKAGQIVLNWMKPDIFFEDEVKGFLGKNPTWNAVKKKISSFKLDERGTLRMYEHALYHYRYMYVRGIVPDNKTLTSIANYYFRHPDVDLGDGNLVNDFAWLAFEKFDDISGLKAALGWSRIALSCTFMDASTIDTYANLLHKLGRSEEALVYAGIAAQADPDNLEVQSNFKKIKAGLPTWINK